MYYQVSYQQQQTPWGTPYDVTVRTPVYRNPFPPSFQSAGIRGIDYDVESKSQYQRVVTFIIGLAVTALSIISAFFTYHTEDGLWIFATGTAGIIGLVNDLRQIVKKGYGCANFCLRIITVPVCFAASIYASFMMIMRSIENSA